MSWSYSGDPSASVLDAVRYLIGDTNVADQQLQDAEINYAIGLFSNTFRAAEMCCTNLAAKYARLVSISIDNMKVEYQQRFQTYTSLAATMKTQSQNAVANGLGVPFVGGTQVADLDSAKLNTDRVQNDFTHDMMDNPAPSQYLEPPGNVI